MTEPPTISKRAEQGLRHQLKKNALDRCKPCIEAYVACTKPRLLSVIWECRGQLDEMNECLAPYTSDEALGRLKERWHRAGQPETPDWADLLKDIELEAPATK
ncbi:hypothetical protein BSKO_03511 [Bryopsis sp. KO-2023]|nr:hypothetical protein BSKO_03511 [Bryopsis sp. KO-2023]